MQLHIVPDSSTNVCINHCYVRNGGDVIGIKSGWDEYGISFAQPSSNISISNIIGETEGGAGIAIGSEMSGGISEVQAEGLHIVNSLHGIKIKTAPGRGGYVRNVYIADVSMHNVSMAIRITGNYGEHPDNNYDINALPVISNITVENVVGVDVGIAGILEGIQGDNFSSICISNVSLSVRSIHPWSCSLIQGYSNSVTPESCEQLSTDCGQTPVCYDGGRPLAVRVQEVITHRTSGSGLLDRLLKLAMI